jgi:hypothetical protein
MLTGRYVSITEYRQIHVRDAEVPGSNPGSPTTEAAVQGLHRWAAGQAQY